jgi:hypothetical protein
MYGNCNRGLESLIVLSKYDTACVSTGRKVTVQQVLLPLQQARIWSLNIFFKPEYLLFYFLTISMPYSTTNDFLVIKISDSFPLVEVMTAAATKYVVRIQEEVL